MTLPARKTAKRIRAFTLAPVPEGSDAYGLRLREVTGVDRGSGLQVHVNAFRTRRVIESVLVAAKASGYPKSALGPSRTTPLTLNEAAGVRLALVLLTTVPLKKSRRVDAIAQAIAGMATEEAFYWYAKCVGPDGRRSRRALRIMLAEE